MILVLSGTGDGRNIVRVLAEKGYRVLAAAATCYGGQLLADSGAEQVVARPLGKEDLLQLIEEQEIEAVIDLTHPYAQKISALAVKICQELQLPYLRYERAEVYIPTSPLLIHTGNYRQAAEKAAALGETVFLTTGSKTLDIFVQAAREKGRRIIARVLPQPQILKRCLDLGLTPADVIAMQGPFSKALNLEMLRHYQASVLVTKNSGQVGGTDAKIEAALELKIPVVIVDRPESPIASAFDNFSNLLLELEKTRKSH